jgi:hypothetical protein
MPISSNLLKVKPLALSSMAEIDEIPFRLVRVGELFPNVLCCAAVIFDRSSAVDNVAMVG